MFFRKEVKVLNPEYKNLTHPLILWRTLSSLENLKKRNTSKPFLETQTVFTEIKMYRFHIFLETDLSVYRSACPKTSCSTQTLETLRF